MPGPAFISSQSRSNSATTTNVVTGDMPPSVTLGDALLAHVVTKVASGGSVGTLTPPVGSNWIEVPNTNRHPNTNLRSAIYFKRGEATEPASYAWTSEFNAASTVVIARYEPGIIRTGASSGNDSGTITGSLLTSLSIFPGILESTLLLYWTSGSGSDTIAAPNAGSVRRYKSPDLLAPSRILVLDEEALTSDAATGNRTLSQGASNTIWTANQIALSSTDQTPPAAPTGITATLVDAND